jgi:rhodanese-related sulfurtransferase
MGRVVKALLAVTVVALGLAACSPAEPSELADDTVVVDVRTPEEFAAGHLEGALNIDVQAEGFAARVAELDPAAAYVVYCRTGNRADAAVELMTAQGFDRVTNAGSLEDAASSTGLAVVTS